MIRCLTVFWVLSTLLWLSASQVFASDLTEQADRAYRQALFYYFQGQDQATLHSVALAEEYTLQEEQIQQLALIKGAASVGVGMYQQAQQIFEALLATNLSEQIEAKSWYWLAKAAFEQNQFEVAYKAIESLRERQLLAVINRSQQADIFYQMAIIKMRWNESDWAKLIDKLPKENIFRAYLLYNLAMQQASNHNYKAALDTLNKTQRVLQVTQKSAWWPFFTPEENEELAAEKLALMDKVFLAQGQMLLLSEDFPAARERFARIGQSALDSGLAMFSLASALDQHGDHAGAMAVWHYLQQNEQSYIAYPASFSLAMAFDELGDKRQAMNSYLSIEKRLREEEVKLTQLLDELGSPSGLNALLSNAPLTGGWPIEFQDIWVAFLSGDESANIQTYQALLAQQQSLDKLYTRTQDLLMLLDEREAQRHQRAQWLAQNQIGNRLAELENQQRQLLMLLDQSEQSPALLADAIQKQQLQRWQQAQERLSALSDATDLSPQYAKRLKRVKGILQWQLTESHIPRKWQLASQLKQTNLLIDKAHQQQGRLNKLAVSNEDLTAQEIAVLALQKRVEHQSVALAARLKHQSEGLLVALKSQLLARQSLYQQYQNHSKLARVRLQDLPSITDEAEVTETSEGGR